MVDDSGHTFFLSSDPVPSATAPSSSTEFTGLATESFSWLASVTTPADATEYEAYVSLLPEDSVSLDWSCHAFH